MKRFCLILIGAMLAGAVIAQTITGTVRERSSNDAIPYATVSLLRPDSSLVTGTISNDNGHFQLQANKGNYILQVSYVGYNTVCRDVQADKSKVATGDIYLTEETTAIAEVEVKADRPLIQRQMDKLVMNVSNSPFAIGFSGEEILKRAPGVMIDKDGNVTLNGKSVSVYIDGRPSYLDGEQLTALLQGTDAATIEKIEIITHPSAKFDAAGEGGAIINIKLKKDKNKGTNGNISVSYGGMYFKQIDKYLQNERFSFSLNHRSAHTYTSLSVNQAYNTHGHQNVSYTQQPYKSDTLRTTGSSVSTGCGQWYNAKLSTDWYIDDKNTLGFILRAPIRLHNGSQPAEGNPAVITFRDDTVQHILTNNTDRNFSPNYNANLNYTHVFNDSLSRELTIDATFNRSDSRAGSWQTNTLLVNVDSVLSRVPDRLDIQRRRISNRYVLKADFQTAFWQTGMIECGGKWQLNQSGNDMQTDSLMPDYSSTTHAAYNYNEHVAALYISVAKRFGEHWNTKIGLRGELTATHGIFTRGDEQRKIAPKPYFNLFPNVYVGYDPTDKWSLSLTYDRSIWRPGFWYLNPFVEYYSAHSYEVGNPELKPEFSHNVEFNVGWSRYVSLNLWFAHTDGIINQRPEMQDNGDIRFTPVNFGKEISYGTWLSLTEIPVVPKFKTNDEGKRELDGAWLALTANVGLNENISIADSTIDSEYGTLRAFHAYFYGELTAYLPKEWQISTNIWGSTPYTSGYERWSGGFSWGAVVKKRWKDPGLTLSVNVSDILRTSVFKGESVGMKNGYINRYTGTWFGQRVSVSLSWQFGKSQQHKYRKVGDNDDGEGKKDSPGGM